MAIKVERDGLEKAFNNDGKVSKAGKSSKVSKDQPQIPAEEEVGFHKGSLNTLAAERNELVKMIQNVESIMQAHLKRLEELGVDIKKE